MIPNNKQFEVAQREAAEQALAGLSGSAKVHFALKVMLSVTDPTASGALLFASRQSREHGLTLSSRAYEREFS